MDDDIKTYKDFEECEFVCFLLEMTDKYASLEEWVRTISKGSPEARGKGFVAKEGETFVFLGFSIKSPPEFLQRLGEYHQPFVIGLRALLMGELSPKNFIQATMPRFLSREELNGEMERWLDKMKKHEVGIQKVFDVGWVGGDIKVVEQDG